ncbi:MAG: hypothetical protein KAH54_00795 [Candidatus Sabulitectum sp.]|nr:hypothetical protein [Candidatus Sabulitectum sp.]
MCGSSGTESLMICCSSPGEAGISFESKRPHLSFDEFLIHFTTIFTYARLNKKGMTFELRTPDSRPLHTFRNTWITFLNMVQQVMGDNADL